MVALLWVGRVSENSALARDQGLTEKLCGTPQASGLLAVHPSNPILVASKKKIIKPKGALISFYELDNCVHQSNMSKAKGICWVLQPVATRLPLGFDLRSLSSSRAQLPFAPSAATSRSIAGICVVQFLSVLCVRVPALGVGLQPKEALSV